MFEQKEKMECVAVGFYSYSFVVGACTHPPRANEDFTAFCEEHGYCPLPQCCFVIHIKLK